MRVDRDIALLCAASHGALTMPGRSLGAQEMPDPACHASEPEEWQPAVLERRWSGVHGVVSEAVRGALLTRVRFLGRRFRRGQRAFATSTTFPNSWMAAVMREAVTTSFMGAPWAARKGRPPGHLDSKTRAGSVSACPCQDGCG
jgi:hypothetical protein